MFFSERKICSEIYIKSREYFTDDSILFIVKTRRNAMRKQRLWPVSNVGHDFSSKRAKLIKLLEF